eukprot:TRINITY_DN5077_c0_g1_i1.p1 TRINITY_DN5077_c0_g1~~TRINITY_DN5077_c0_g1_i1.p1  ORF type:complete len:274 (+),score=34.91 TRINITY_DN5077_c0_g1_i1:156-977(+)
MPTKSKSITLDTSLLISSQTPSPNHQSSSVSHSPPPSHTKETPTPTSQPTKTKSPTTTETPTSCIESCRVKKTKYKFTKTSANSDVSVPILATDNTLAGEVRVSAQTFKSGCVLSIKEGSRSGKIDKKDCREDVEVGSASIELQISKPCKSKDFRHPVEIRLYSKKSEMTNCIAFKENNNHDWRCLDSTSDGRKISSDLVEISSKTTHFTTFAVLLGSSSSCSRWIWISSLALVAVCLVLCTIVVFAHYKFYSVRALVAGHYAKRITRLIERT